jgi:two-component system phosphate regulon sensor histidine kinase PhoR
MWSSMVRKALSATVLAAVPPILVLRLSPHATWPALASIVPGVLAALFMAQSWTRQTRELTGFVNRLLDADRATRGLTDNGDDLGELASALTDISPRIDDLVRRLRTELARREAILASMSEGVIAVDARLNVTFCNRAFVQAVGEPNIVEGAALIKAVRDPQLFEILKEVIAAGETVRRRVRLSSHDGPSFDVIAGPSYGMTSRGAIAILHDITPNERLDRMRRDFIANVSHEFRTPLATIRGFAETLLDGGLEDEANRRRFTEIILANGIRLNNIATDLLTLSELEEGKPQTDAGPVPVGEVIGGAVRAVEPSANLAGVRIAHDEAPSVYVWGHRIRFEQAIVNLIDNAVKFNRPRGEVRIRVTMKSKDLTEISIADTGIGIPRQDLDRIFERFYRVDKARSRQQGGTGLGLSIVKHAVQQMNGTVTVESEFGAGSTFRITVPVCAAPARVS